MPKREYIVHPPNPEKYRQYRGHDFGGFKVKARSMEEAAHHVTKGTPYSPGDCHVEVGK